MNSLVILGCVVPFLAAADPTPRSKTIGEVLRQPLPAETLTCAVRETSIQIAGPTFRYTVDRRTGAIAGLEVMRDERVVLQLREPAALWLDDAALAAATGGDTTVVVDDAARKVLRTEGRWRDGVRYSLGSTFFSDGVVVSEITLTPATDLALRRGIQYEVGAKGQFTHYLHKRRDTEGMDCFRGALPQPGDTVRIDAPTSCLEVFSRAAALAVFTDRGAIYRSPPELPAAALRVDAAASGEQSLQLRQHLIHVGAAGKPYTLRANESFTFRVGMAVAPNRPPHPRWRDLRMFIWVGDGKHPYPSDEEIRAAARLGFTLFQMHRLGPPGEPRPPAPELERVLRTVHEAGMLFIWTANADLQYAHAPAISKLVVEGNWSRWQGFNYGGKYRASMDAFCDTLATCLAAPNGLADYRVECTRRMLQRYAVDGMYIDDNLAYANCNLWREHGHPQEVYDCLIELHEMNWRRRQTLLANCPHAVLIDHCSRAFALPVISAFDCHLFGEGYSFPSIEAYRETFGSLRNMYAQGCLFAGDSETTRCGAEQAYAFDLLTGGGQYCYLDWRLWPQKFPYAAGVNRHEPLFVKTYNLAQYDFGLYECAPFEELATTVPGTYAALYRNRVWRDSLVVAANLTASVATCSLADPESPARSLDAGDSVVAYDVHNRRATPVEDRGVACFSKLELQPHQVRLVYLRQTAPHRLYHQWGGKRISEQWDAAARRLSLRVFGPAGLEDGVVLGVCGRPPTRVTVDGRPAEFFFDSDRNLVHGKVTYRGVPILVEATTMDEAGLPGAARTLPCQPLSPDELTTTYR